MIRIHVCNYSCTTLGTTEKKKLFFHKSYLRIYKPCRQLKNCLHENSSLYIDLSYKKKLHISQILSPPTL